MNFENTYWLWIGLLVLSIFLILLWMDRSARHVAIRRFASDRLVGGLLRSYSSARRRTKTIMLVIALLLLFFSLARPQWGYDWRETRTRGVDVLFALDTSRSMLAQDIRPNRLIRAKLAIEDLVLRLEGDRIGLIAFAGEAFLQCPLTLDYNAFLQTLEAMDTDVIPLGGTDIGMAISEAQAAFPKNDNYKILILLSDGEDLEERAISQAKEAAEDGITIYTVGIGSEEGTPIQIRTPQGTTDYIRDANGAVVHTRLDVETLQTIAEVTNGFYVPLGPTAEGLNVIYETVLSSIPREEIKAQLEQNPVERYQWFLSVAFILLLIEPLLGTRKNRTF